MTNRETAPPAPAPDLGRLEELASKATPGPWSTEGTRRSNRGMGGHVFKVGPEDRMIAACRGASGYELEEHDANAAYLAALDPATVSWLVARARRAEELEKRDECVVCGASCLPDSEPTHCHTCLVPLDEPTPQGAPHDD